MKKLFKTLFTGLTVVLLAASSSQADLAINLSHDGSGGTNLEFVGSGTVSDDGGAAFVYEDLSNTMHNLSSGFVNDMSIGPSDPVFGGGDWLDFWVVSGPDGTGNLTIQANWNAVVGGDLSAENGNVFNLDDIAFSIFNPGSYTLTKFPTFADVGNVTLNVASIPEPGSFGALALMSTFFLRTRRRK